MILDQRASGPRPAPAPGDGAALAGAAGLPARRGGSGAVRRGFWSGAGRLVGLAYRGYYRSLRLQALSPTGASLPPREHPVAGEIWAFCERDALALGGMAVGRRFTALVSHGRDGDWAAAALAALGCTALRGSSRRGGWPALRALLRHLQTAPGPLALVIDGPLGPAGRVRPGALICARDSGLPVRPVAAAARHCLVFPQTWSGIYLPLPFTRVRIALGERLAVPADASTDEIAELTTEMERRLADARRRAAGKGAA
jgi:lysophospholipid acyltransferase (LPLAT)-like uncharacterized protein